MSGGMVRAIWAQDRGGVIGAAGDMLWRVPADFRFFRTSTLGGVLVLGRVTYESIGGVLDGREMVVITSQSAYRAPGAHVVPDLASALATARQLAHAAPTGQVWIAGGGTIYQAALPFTDECVVTTIDLDVRADPTRQVADAALVYAPALPAAQWQPVQADPQWRPRSGDARWRVTTYRRR